MWSALVVVLVVLLAGPLHGQTSDGADLALATLKQARALAAEGRLEQALEKTERALAFGRAELGPFDPLVGFILDDLATLNYRLGRYDQALGFAEEALAVIGAGRGTQSIAHALVASNLGAILTAVERPEDALALYRDALPLLEQNLGRGHQRTAAIARNLATLQAALGDHAAAAATYTIAIEGWRQLQPDGPVAARLMIDRARVLLRLGRVEQAAADAGAARGLLAKQVPVAAADLAEADLVMADLDLHALRPLVAEDRLVEAGARLMAERPVDRQSVTRVESRRASLELLLGRAPAARQRLLGILDAERRRLGGDHPSLGVVYRRLGEAHLAEHRVPAAEDAFEEARRLLEDDRERVLTDLLMVRVALADGRIDDASRQLQSVQGLGGDLIAILEGAAPTSLGRLISLAPAPLKQRLTDHLEDVAGSPAPPCRRARALVAQAAWQREQGAYGAAEERLERAVDTLRQGTACPDQTGLEAALALADFRLADGRADEASDLVRLGLGSARLWPVPRALLDRALDLVAGAHPAMTDEGALDLAFEIAQQVASDDQQAVSDALARAVIESEGKGASRLLQRRRLAGGIRARLALLNGAHPFDGARLAEETLAIALRAVAEDLERLAELDRALREAAPELARLLPEAFDLAEVQATLSPGEAVLLQVTGPATSHLFLLSSDSVRYAQTNLGNADLEGWVAAALAAIGAPAEAFDSFALHALYVGLVSPFAEGLDGVEHLIVLADGAARRLPFAVLVTQPAEPIPPGGAFAPLDYLIDRTAVSTIADLSALMSTRSPSRAPDAFAGFAAPTSADEPAPEPGRAARVQAITAAVDADKALLNLQVAERGIAAVDLDRYRILAFALPVARDAAGLPALAFTPGSSAPDRLLNVEDLARLDLDADLVMLLDDDAPRSADEPEPIELLPALALAGARAVLTTYWAVGPDPVSRVAGPVVDAVLKDSASSVGQALRAAILPLVDDAGGPAAAHPSFWAPFGASLGAR